MKLEHYEISEMVSELFPSNFTTEYITDQQLAFKDPNVWDRYDTIKMQSAMIFINKKLQSGPYAFFVYVVDSVFYFDERVYENIGIELNKESAHFANIKIYNVPRNPRQPAVLLN